MLLIYMSFIDDESHRRLFEEIYLSYRKQMFLVARTVLGAPLQAVGKYYFFHINVPHLLLIYGKTLLDTN